MLNEELVRAGLAEARLGWNFSSTLKRRLRLAQEEARRANRGIWSD
jgi:endonuclease YncB( thermonuclease family)